MTGPLSSMVVHASTNLEGDLLGKEGGRLEWHPSFAYEFKSRGISTTAEVENSWTRTSECSCLCYDEVRCGATTPAGCRHLFCIKGEGLFKVRYRVPSPPSPTIFRIFIPPSQRAGRVTSGTPGQSIQTPFHHLSRPTPHPVPKFVQAIQLGNPP